MFNKVVSYRLGVCDFVGNSFAKISLRKFLENLKRAILQNPCRKTSVVESPFNEKEKKRESSVKNTQTKSSTCEYIRTFSSSSGRSFMSSAFSIGFTVVYTGLQLYSDADPP